MAYPKFKWYITQLRSVVSSKIMTHMTQQTQWNMKSEIASFREKGFCSSTELGLSL